MAHLFLNTVSDSVYLDVTAGEHSAIAAVEAANGVLLHLDDSRAVVGIEVLDISRRRAGDADEPEMGLLHVNTGTDSLYFDVSGGTLPPVEMAPIADDVYVHVDNRGALVAIEVMRLSRRGGLRVSDLDSEHGSARPAIFDEIERVAAGQSRS